LIAAIPTFNPNIQIGGVVANILRTAALDATFDPSDLR
jgi:hypothetical protein